MCGCEGAGSRASTQHGCTVLLTCPRLQSLLPAHLLSRPVAPLLCACSSMRDSLSFDGARQKILASSHVADSHALSEAAWHLWGHLGICRVIWMFVWLPGYISSEPRYRCVVHRLCTSPQAGCNYRDDLELLARVEDWRARVEPVLREEECRAEFDIRVSADGASDARVAVSRSGLLLVGMRRGCGVKGEARGHVCVRVTFASRHQDRQHCHLHYRSQFTVRVKHVEHWTTRPGPTKSAVALWLFAIPPLSKPISLRFVALAARHAAPLLFARASTRHRPTNPLVRTSRSHPVPSPDMRRPAPAERNARVRAGSVCGRARAR
eukprot:6173074-Pleurochrysis_carterae.AAC.1